MLDWGATVTAAPLGDAGGGVKQSFRVIPPGRATISGQKVLIGSARRRIWGRWWIGVPQWLLYPLMTLVEG